MPQPRRRRKRAGDASQATPPAGGTGSDGGAARETLPTAEALNQALERDHRELRQRVLTRLATPEFARGAAPPADYRAQVREWLRLLAADGIGGLAFPAEFGGVQDASAAIAAFETLALHDLSLLVKFGVHFGLFGGSVFLLGTRAHHEKYLRDIATLALPGCFAMTETGHGSNVRDIETTASYDAATREFVIETPHAQARKDYIGNAAEDGRMAVVFAQLRVAGEEHGVHALLVPIRDAAGRVASGVTIEDCGPKAGLNGVDNGRLSFQAVRVPRENLLDRFAQVTESGTYQSAIESPGRRFFTMLSALVAGRISIAAASNRAAESSLTIAVRYLDRRRQFGPEGGAEQRVLDYPALQLRIMPLLARTCALHFALAELVRRFRDRAEDDRELEALAAGVKAYASQHGVDTARSCREACAGQGYLAENRLGAIAADTDVFTTFEGANDVLYQLVARGLLTDYREQFEDLRGTVRYFGTRAAAVLAELDPIGSRRTDEAHLLDDEFQRRALAFRRERLVDTLARRMRRRLDQGAEPFAAWNECQDHALAAARAFVEAWVLDQFRDGAARAAGDPERTLLGQVGDLFATDALYRDRAWFLEAGVFEPGKTKAIRDLRAALCARLRPQAGLLVAGFAIPDAILAAPIGATTAT